MPSESPRTNPGAPGTTAHFAGLPGLGGHKSRGTPFKPVFGLSGIATPTHSTVATPRTNVILERSEGSAVQIKRGTAPAMPSESPRTNPGAPGTTAHFAGLPGLGGHKSRGTPFKPVFGLSGIATPTHSTVATPRTNVILERSEGSAVQIKRGTAPAMPSESPRTNPGAPGTTAHFAGLPGLGGHKSRGTPFKPVFGLSGIATPTHSTVATPRTNVILERSEGSAVQIKRGTAPAMPSESPRTNPGAPGTTAHFAGLPGLGGHKSRGTPFKPVFGLSGIATPTHSTIAIPRTNVILERRRIRGSNYKGARRTPYHPHPQNKSGCPQVRPRTSRAYLGSGRHKSRVSDAPGRMSALA
jgi:glycine/serine hydroxymethyltransferase